MYDMFPTKNKLNTSYVKSFTTTSVIIELPDTAYMYVILFYVYLFIGTTYGVSIRIYPMTHAELSCRSLQSLSISANVSKVVQ